MVRDISWRDETVARPVANGGFPGWDVRHRFPSRPRRVGRGSKCVFLGDFEFFQNAYSRFLGVFGVFVDGGKGNVPFRRGILGFFGPSFSRGGVIVPRGISLGFRPANRAAERPLSLAFGLRSLIWGRRRGSDAGMPSPKTEVVFSQNFSKSARFAPWSVVRGQGSGDRGRLRMDASATTNDQRRLSLRERSASFADRL